MSHPHNAEHILEIIEAVHQDRNIWPEKVQAIATDNGSNMVKAFRQHLIDLDEDTDVDTHDGDVDIEDTDVNENVTSSEQDEDDFDAKEIDHN